MRRIIMCKNEDSRVLNFYMNDGKRTRSLFRIPFNENVYRYFKKEVPLERAIDHTYAKRDKAINHTMNIIREFVWELNGEEDNWVFD